MASRNEPTPTKNPNEQGISRRQVLARGFVVAIGAALMALSDGFVRCCVDV